MRRWLLILAIAAGSPAVVAESRPADRPLVEASDTVKAESATRLAEHQVAQLTVYRASLAKRYQDELEQIDRLKNQRASWRRDRELRDSLSASLETANQLSAATRELERAKTGLASARHSYLVAIEAEVIAGAEPARLQQLTQARSQLMPQVKIVPRRIVIPDLEIDPLADPEELDQRAAELRASEEDLSRQLATLKTQASELDRVASLRRQHDRAGDLFNRDGDEPHRAATRAPSEVSVAEETGGAARPSASLVTPAPNFENFVPIVLSDVIDASTINSLAAAQRSGDPALRAEASHRAGDAVARRLGEIRKRRLEIEARARVLRGQP